MSIENVHSANLNLESIGMSAETRSNDAIAKVFEEMLLKLMIDSSEMFSSENNESKSGLDVWKEVIKNGLVSGLVSRDEIAYGRFMMQRDEITKGVD